MLYVLYTGSYSHVLNYHHTLIRINCYHSVDCGIFVMAYAHHIALGLPMEFTKDDMYYFRAKIVSDIYVDQYTHWTHRRPDGSDPDQSDA